MRVTGGGGDAEESGRDLAVSGEVIVHGPPLTDPIDLAQLQHLNEGEVAVVVPRNTLVDFGPRDDEPRVINGADEFDRLFTTFAHTAWRLETRRRFASDEATPEWQQFAAGRPIDWDYDDDWCRNVRVQTGQGKRFERVRLVDDPITPGQLYLRSNAARNCAVGEDIRNLSRVQADELHLPAEDFWLFDSRLVARLLFDDDDEAVRARIRRQEGLWEPGRTYRILMWEAACFALVCPPSVLAAQLDRLTSVIGLDTVEFGIVPFSASLKIYAGNAFWIYDDRRVVVEDWHAELWLDDADSVATYQRVWDTLRESAVYGADAQNTLGRARRALCPR
ncbi:DUF6879 family protein [Streptomyces sp. KLOTTS4A1]|uniref:DUF6879 family protein n=1 Tax=Streptomyces sp. KLOTTS4A1 TaxID=3390996 RepID=UPI0039F56917